MTHLLLVEDDLSLGQTLKERLQKEGYEVSWVETLESARQVLKDLPAHLIILDVGLPDGSGFEFAQEIRQNDSVPIIFVTAQTSAESRLAGYEVGAEEYIPKPFHLKELLLRVKHVLENHVSPYRLTQAGVTVDFESMTVETEDGRSEALPKKDFEILRLLMTSSPRVLSRDEILNKVWGEDKFPSNRTIDNIIMRLRQALGTRAGQCIRSVRSVGYQWKVEGDSNE